jgi:hypothetical protein
MKFHWRAFADVVSDMALVTFALYLCGVATVVVFTDYVPAADDVAIAAYFGLGSIIIESVLRDALIGKREHETAADKVERLRRAKRRAEFAAEHARAKGIRS